jgi:hypothetical protein
MQELHARTADFIQFWTRKKLEISTISGDESILLHGSFRDRPVMTTSIALRVCKPR